MFPLWTRVTDRRLLSMANWMARRTSFFVAEAEIGDDGDEKKGDVRVVSSGKCASGNCVRLSALTTLLGPIGVVRTADTSDHADDTGGPRLHEGARGGDGNETGEHAASLSGGRPGVLHGNRTYLLQDGDGQITDAHSISAGLDYPGVGPEHALLKAIGREAVAGKRDVVWRIVGAGHRDTDLDRIDGAERDAGGRRLCAADDPYGGSFFPQFRDHPERQIFQWSIYERDPSRDDQAALKSKVRDAQAPLPACNYPGP